MLSYKWSSFATECFSKTALGNSIVVTAFVFLPISKHVEEKRKPKPNEILRFISSAVRRHGRIYSVWFMKHVKTKRKEGRIAYYYESQSKKISAYFLDEVVRC